MIRARAHGAVCPPFEMAARCRSSAGSRATAVACAYGPPTSTVLDAHAVQRNLLRARPASSSNALRSCAIRSGVALGRRLELAAADSGAGRWIRPVVARAAGPRRCAGSPPRSVVAGRQPDAGTARVCPPKSCRSSSNVAERSGSNGSDVRPARSSTQSVTAIGSEPAGRTPPSADADDVVAVRPARGGRHGTRSAGSGR